ncbi:MAG TPA: Fe-S cluster assembly ATPase SufC [Patescibacteria group bacterium]|nr:Fe-S cluster assembly ATPase SufC [Patescibacteria group bacterium]
MNGSQNRNNALHIEDLAVSSEGKKILNSVNLTIRRGEIHALMGPNGSGKSTLAYALMGHPGYQIDRGKISLQGKDLTTLSPEKRARAGLFLAFQYPVSVPGVTVANFLRVSLNSLQKSKERLPLSVLQTKIHTAMDKLRIPEEFATRYLNDGFSGGEKKKTEILQMMILEPSFAVLDETDSGLDVDALRIVAEGINFVAKRTGILLITHYQRLLDFIRPDVVHILMKGNIVASGGPDLAEKIEEKGYDWVKRVYLDEEKK